MINIAICEDDEDDRKILKKYIKEVLVKKQLEGILDNYTIYEYKNAEDMLPSLQTTKYHVVFLDMFMGNMLGIELAQRIRLIDTQTIIIFITSSRDFAVDGYRVRAYHYLIKPINLTRIQEVTHSAIDHLMEKECRYFLFPTQDGLCKQDLNEIYYIECTDRKTSIITQSKIFICTYSINALEEKLNQLGFVRCHRSFIVHLKYVRSFKQGAIFLENGHEIFLSKYKQKDVKDKLTKYLGGQL
ncbi:MAG: LytTR family DNA-binding domain-containing protein [Cellulosilyticaceae bacterium]